MNHNTTWYPADVPDEAPQQLPPLPHQLAAAGRTFSEPKIPFRVVTFNESAPYPNPESHQPSQQPFMVDLLSDDQWHTSSPLDQPNTEDFLRLHRPLLPPPVEEHDSDQDFEVVEQDTYLDSSPAIEQLHNIGAIIPERRDTITASKPFDIVKPETAHKRSQTAPELPLAIPHRPVSPDESASTHSTPGCAPTMADDFFSPVLGGLQRLPSTPSRESKSRRFKRWFSFRSRRKYGPASR